MQDGPAFTSISCAAVARSTRDDNQSKIYKKQFFKFKKVKQKKKQVE